MYIANKEELNSKDRIINNLQQRIKELEEINHKLNLSIINSKTAKNGYKEEDKICEDLNVNDEIREAFSDMLPDDYDFCRKIPGTGKVDVMSDDKKIRAQVKKYKIGQFQQIDRHWIDNIIRTIPNLKDIEEMLKKWCEIPLKSNGTHINKSQKRVLLSKKNYNRRELSNFIRKLNISKKEILDYIFYGTEEIKPEYLIGVEYEGDKRKQIVMYNINDIIDDLNKKSFQISKSNSVINLGNYLTIQRKGGDGGKKSSNQIQFKIIISKINIKNNIKYKL